MGTPRAPGIRPRPTLRRAIDNAACQALPAAGTAFLLLLLAAPLRLPGQAQLQPAALLACVFFWSLFRPAAMRPGIVFLLGLLADLVSLTPPGLSALVALGAHGVAARWRRELAFQSFPVVWLAFCAVAAGAAALQWAAVGLLSLRLMPGDAALYQLGLSAGSYPLFSALLARAGRGANPDGSGAT